MTEDPNRELPSTKPVPDGFTTLTEGQATILTKGANEAFYNPAQVVNRDLSIAVINYFQTVRSEDDINMSRGQRKKVRTAADGGLRVLEGLAATGLRSIRYAREIEGDIDKIVANDLDPNVVESMRRNIDFNGEDVSSKVEASVGDARVVMITNRHGFDVVDLDPYGAPSVLLDSAIESVSEGGLLLCTATDMATLCGNVGEACFAKYGSYPLHKPYCHEQGIRILLAMIAKSAARYKRHIVPVISLSIDFYVRVFVRVFTSANEVKDLPLKLSYVYQSQGCDSYELAPIGRLKVTGNSRKYGPAYGPPVAQHCPETGASYTIGGPIWSDPIHDKEWIKGVLTHMKSSQKKYKAFEKIQGLLTNAMEELPDVPLYLDLHSICKVVKSSVPKHEVFKSALINAGYRVSPTHCNPKGIKTDAPWSFIWDVIRAWVKEHPTKLAEGSPGFKIMEKELLRTDISFSRAKGSVTYKSKKRVPRFVQNERNWGPKTMHGKKIKKMPTEDTASKKSETAEPEKTDNDT
jgi:tRNA (guanine26-N2/guanine27-N2)-dimethyltransferase